MHNSVYSYIIECGVIYSYEKKSQRKTYAVKVEHETLIMLLNKYFPKLKYTTIINLAISTGLNALLTNYYTTGLDPNENPTKTFTPPRPKATKPNNQTNPKTKAPKKERKNYFANADDLHALYLANLPKQKNE